MRPALCARDNGGLSRAVTRPTHARIFPIRMIPRLVETRDKFPSKNSRQRVSPKFLHSRFFSTFTPYGQGSGAIDRYRLAGTGFANSALRSLLTAGLLVVPRGRVETTFK